MRQRIDLQEVWSDAREQLEAAAYDGQPAPPWPATCPVTLDQLLQARRAELEDLFRTATDG